MKHVFALAAILALTPPAFAETPSQLLAFEQGQYSDAARLGEAAATPDSLAFAARSLLAEAMSAPDFIPPQPLVVKAEGLAQQALAADARHIEGRLQLAIALSLRARPLSTAQAMNSGFGSQAKDLAEAVLKDDPTNAYAHGFLAVWNIEVVRRGGSVGSAIMGASLKQARKHYSAATRRLPQDAATHWQYARAMAALNARKYRAEIDAALAEALAAEPATVLDALMQARATRLQEALATQSVKQVEALAERML